MKKFA